MRPYEIVAKHNMPPNWPNTRTKPPEWLLDLIAERKLMAGYDKRNLPCKVCFIRKSLSGRCNCD